MSNIFQHTSAVALNLVLIVSLSTWAQADIVFEDFSAESGINYTGGSYGIAWGDIDDDDLVDLWLTNHSEEDHLYQNLGGGIFERVNGLSLPASGVDNHGVAWLDIEGDGDDDVVILSGGGSGLGETSNNLFRNDTASAPLFADIAPGVGLEYPEGRGRTPHFLDIDNDFDLDIVFNGISSESAPPTIFLQESDGTFQNENGVIGFTPSLATYSVLGRIHNDDLYLIAHAPNFPRATYNTSVTPMSDTSHLFFSSIEGGVQDSVLADFDGDLLPDLFLTRGYEASEAWQPSPEQLNMALIVIASTHVVRFLARGTFAVDVYPKNVAGQQGPWKLDEIYIGQNGINPVEMPFELTEQNPAHHGFFQPESSAEAIVIGYDVNALRWEVRVSSPAIAPLAELLVESPVPIQQVETIGFESFTPGSDPTLLHNDGERFVDVPLMTGAPMNTNCFGAAAADFDNDMDIDVFMSCNSLSGNLPNVLLENMGNGTFIELAGAAGASGSDVGRSEAVATSDIDNDGLMDLLVANGQGWAWSAFNQGPTDVFRNATSNENFWLHINLVGTISNRSAIGALILLTTPDGNVQRRESDGGMHRLAQNHSRIHFGLGGNENYSSIEIRWPSGIVQFVPRGAANQILTVVEPLILDLDDDGVIDSDDNCRNLFNPSQCDSNNDGFGNHCDADFDGSLLVNFLDLQILGNAFFTVLGDPAYDADLDLNCSGSIDFLDLNIMTTRFFQPPGPSGLVP